MGMTFILILSSARDLERKTLQGYGTHSISNRNASPRRVLPAEFGAQNFRHVGETHLHLFLGFGRVLLDGITFDASDLSDATDGTRADADVTKALWRTWFAGCKTTVRTTHARLFRRSPYLGNDSFS